MSTASQITITPIQVGDLTAVEMPVFVHLIDHPDARILVDTGFTELHPAIADMEPVIQPLSGRELDLTSIDLVVNTHLHFDHCGGNSLFPGVPMHVQRQELTDARTLPEYTITEWVDPPGQPLNYVEVDGDHELLPGVRLLATPGHTRGSQVVAVTTAAGVEVIAGDTAVWSGELDDPQTEGQRRIVSLHPVRVWLSHQVDPW
ncbi:MAG TPA: MBL fold metallo-hydrolase [Marmoricola sp.]|nr:MBL fold metallo-hydrolase [Marmoricola sp.]